MNEKTRTLTREEIEDIRNRLITRGSVLTDEEAIVLCDMALSAPSRAVTEWLIANAPDCGDNSCLFGGQGKGGMRTNGGCRCFKDLPTGKRIYVERLASALRSAPPSSQPVAEHP